ncbi:hypothetical protein GW934_02480, partial [Candidatus Falkowbacteria bacterium]|nr:hypothetical protein [Candidatus Falkowbacteria bacterium]
MSEKNILSGATTILGRFFIFLKYSFWLIFILIITSIILFIPSFNDLNSAGQNAL